MTPAQKDIYNILINAEIKGEATPTYRELADKAGLKSTSGVHRVIEALEAQGRITRLKNTKRSIKINLNLSAFRRGYEKGLEDAKAEFNGRS